LSECQYADRLSAYHDDELSPPARAEVENHLAQCPACAAELARMEKLSQAFAGLRTPPQVSPRTMQRLHRRIDALPGLAIARLAEALTAVAASIVIACGAWLWSSSAPAGAAAMPVWEAAVLQKPAEAAPPQASEDRLAGWIVQDLSREGGHDQE
jgi:anti-sigma factor RsiW